MFTQRSHYENFPVASVLLPARMRKHVAAVYAFARTADDFADEGSLTVPERLALLDGWSHRLHQAGGASVDAPRAGEPPDTVRMFEQLARTMREKRLSCDLFDALLSAFRQDVTVHRYEAWAQLLDYCSRSANPVGRIVLRIADHHDDEMDQWSDAICTALQLTNFWQDLRVDFERGRIYVPAEVMRAHAVDETALGASEMNAAWRGAVAEMVARTRRLFHDGRPLCTAVSGRLRLELQATWLGGMRILDRIEGAGFDGLAVRPVLTKADLPWFVGRMATWSLSTARS